MSEIHELECPKRCGEVISGSDEKAVKETMARHMAKFHPEPVKKAPPKAAEQPKAAKK